MDTSGFEERSKVLLAALSRHVSDSVAQASRAGGGGGSASRKPCGIVVDPRLASLLYHASGTDAAGEYHTTGRFLQCTGASQEFFINENEDIEWREDGPLVIFVRPNPRTCRALAQQLQSSFGTRAKRPDLRCVFVPRRSFRCESIALKEVAKWFTQDFHAVPLTFVQVEKNLLSCEMDEFLRETRAEQDTFAYTMIARALLEVKTSLIQGVGLASAEVIKLYAKMRQESEARGMALVSGKANSGGDSESMTRAGTMESTFGLEEEEEDDLFVMATEDNGPLDRIGTLSSVPLLEVDSILILDREVDMVSPLMTPLTYEALLDEFVGVPRPSSGARGILPGQVMPVQKDVLRGFGDQQDESSSSSRGGDVVELSLGQGQDPIFSLVRHESAFAVMPLLNAEARKLKEEQERVHRTHDPDELERIVQRIPELQQTKRKLETHIALRQRLDQITLDRRNHARIEAERKLVFQKDPGPLRDMAWDCAARGEPLLKVLRMLCLSCIVEGGFYKRAELDSIRRDLIQLYGFETVLSLDYLDRIGLLSERPFHPQHFARKDMPTAAMGIYMRFEEIRDALELCSDAEDDPCAFVFSGIAPISARLVEMELKCRSTLREEWKLAKDKLDRHPLSEHRIGRAPLPSKRSALLVVFLGGVSRAELAAIRKLEKKFGASVIVATTGIINGTELIRQCAHPSLLAEGRKGRRQSQQTTTTTTFPGGALNPFAD